MYLATEPGRSESGPFVIDDYFLWLFIRRVPVKDNTASECIRTVAATYGYKILQLYEYDANVYGYDANFEWHPKNTSSCSIKDSWLPGWDISASIWTVHVFKSK